MSRWRISFCCKTCGKWDIKTPAERLAARFDSGSEALRAFAAGSDALRAMDADRRATR